MCRDSIVVVAFPDEVAATRGAGGLLDLNGGFVVFAAAVLANEGGGRRRVVPALEQSPLSVSLARLLVRVTAGFRANPTTNGASEESRKSEPDWCVLAEVLTVLPSGNAAVVAEIFESAPPRFERRMTALGGRIIHRRPPLDSVDDPRPNGASLDPHAAVQAKIAVLEGRIGGTAGTAKGLLVARLAQLHAELRHPASTRGR